MAKQLSRKRILALSFILAFFFFIMAKLEQQDLAESTKIEKAILERK
jgi:hypothetical protein